MDLMSWLESHELGRFAQAFHDHAIEVVDLSEMTHSDLREVIGVERFADRKRILEAAKLFALEHEGVRREITYPEGLAADELPTYLAHPFHALCAEDHPRVKLHWLTDTAELAVRWCVAVALAEVLSNHDLRLPDHIARQIRHDIERPTLGRWLGILRELSQRRPEKTFIDPGVFTVYETTLEPLFTSERTGGTIQTSLLVLRNQIAHGGGMSTQRASELLEVHEPRLHDMLRAILAPTTVADIVAVHAGEVHRLLGLDPERIEAPASLLDIMGNSSEWDDRGGAWLCKGDIALPLLPLAIYEPVHHIDASGQLRDKPGGSAPQVFTRAGHDRLSYTPLGRDEAHSEVLAIDFFREVFRLDADLAKEQGDTDGLDVEAALRQARLEAEDLIGRRAEIKHVKQFLKAIDPQADDTHRMGWISGGPGLGKSMVMSQLASDYGSGQSKTRAFFFHRFDGGGNARSNKRTFLKLLEAALWQWEPLKAITTRPDPTHDGDDLLDALEARLAKIAELEAPNPRAPKPSVWIFIDNFDEMVGQDSGFTDLVRKFAVPGTVWLMCGRPEHGLDDELSSGICRHVFEGGLPVMSAEDIRAMLLEGLGNARYALLKRDEDDDEGVHNLFIEHVVDRARGLPLYVDLLLDDLRVGNLTVDDDEKLPDGLGDYYSDLMERVGLSTVARDLPLIVSLLARSEEPLDVESLALLLTPEMDDLPVYRRRVRDALRVGQPLLRTSPTPEGTEGFSLYHQSFREYLGGIPGDHLDAKPPALMIAETVYEAERILYRSAERWRDLPHGNLRNHLFRWGTTYALIYQGDNGLEEARRRLMDFEYLQARHASLPASAAFDLVAEYAELVRRTPSEDRDRLIIWEAFFRERVHILTRADQYWPAEKILLQLAVEHADNSPVTEAAESWLDDGHADEWLWLRSPTRPLKLKQNFARRVFEGHRERIEGTALLGEERILSWSIDHDLKLWELETGVEIETLSGHTDAIDGALLLDGGARALSWDRAGGLFEWDTELGTRVVDYSHHTKPIIACHELPGGQLLSWSEDKSICVWDRGSQNPVRTLTGHTRAIRGAMMLDDDTTLLTWSDDKSLRTWDITTGDELSSLSEHSREIVGAERISADRLVSWDMDNLVCVTDLTSLTLVHKLEGHEDTPMGAMELPDGSLLTWGKDNMINRWGDDGSLAKTWKGHKDWVDGLMFVGESHAVSWSKDKTAILWNVEQGRKLQVLEGHAGWVRGATLLSTGELLTWSGGGTMRIWELDFAMGEASLVAVLEGHTAGIYGASELGDGTLLSWSWDGSMRLWSWERDEDIVESPGHKGWIHAHQSWTEGRAMTWASDASAILWDIHSGHPTTVFAGHEKSVDGIIPIGDANAVTWSGDMTLRSWDVTSGESTAQMDGHDKKIQGALQLRDGGVLSWSSDASLKIWSADSGDLRVELSGHKKLVQGAKQLDDGRIVSWSSDATIKVWDPASGELLLDLTEHKKLIKGVKIIDQTRILSHSSDKTLKVWSLTDGECQCTLEGHKKIVESARMLTSNVVLSLSKDFLAIAWDVDTGEQLWQVETDGEMPDGATLMPGKDTCMLWYRKSNRFVVHKMDYGELVEEVDQEDALNERPDLWRARQDAGTYETISGPWRSHGVNGGATLFYDRDGDSPVPVAWREAGSWTNMLLTEDGTLTVHAGPYFHPLHLYRGTERVTLAQAEHIILGDE